MSDPREVKTKDDSGSAGDAAHPNWSVGIVNHGNYADLERCLRSLEKQTRPASRIAVYDTGRDPDAFQKLRSANPAIGFELGPNRGYAGGANRVLSRLMDEDPSPDFVLILNPDIELDTDFASKLLSGMLESPDIAIASGKLLRPGRATIDSAGIRFPRHGRPRDRGSEEPDRGQFDESEIVDAVSGAAMMIRVDAVAPLEIEGELFDEAFFAYHEDTDLCWRARRLQWRILYVPQAQAVHGRGWRKEGRQEIPVAIRRHSFKNHYLQLVKNETLGRGLRNLPWLLTWEILRLGFVLLRDRPMLGAYAEAWRALPEAKRKRALIESTARRVRSLPRGR